MYVFICARQGAAKPVVGLRAQARSEEGRRGVAGRVVGLSAAGRLAPYTGVNPAGAANALPEAGDDAPRAAERLSDRESPATCVAGVAEGVLDGTGSITNRVRVPSVFDHLSWLGCPLAHDRIAAIKNAFAS